MKLTKIHGVLQFNESPWLAKYINFNTNKRPTAKNAFEKDFFKLMNNTVFGKTLENLRKRINLKLTCKEDIYTKHASRANFIFGKMFNENLFAINRIKEELVLNRPICVGMAILDLSKLLMYDFHYNYMLKQVAQRATIAHLSPMCQGQISFQKIQTHPSFNACSCYMKVSKGSNQKQQRKSGNTIFPFIRSIGVFLRRSRAANSVVGGPIWPKFKLIHNIMHVLVTSKFEKDRININRDYVMTSIF